MPLTPSTRLGVYEILAPLGSGGMGEVWRARDPRLKRDIAIKVLPDAVASSPERLARFEREATTVAGLNHPNIVTVHSIEEEGRTRFLTMELVDGRDLSSLVAPGGLPLAQLLDLAIPLVDALVAAHERGVVHRDLKPANVMVTRTGRVKVLDFGLARHTEVEEGATMSAPISEAGHAVGTAPYMAPEQIRAEKVDARADLFSFGVLLYELAAGRRPFEGRSSMEVGSAILRDRPAPLRRVRADLPAELERIVERCLAKEPAERVPTALELLHELQQLRRASEPSSPARAAATREESASASIAVLPFVNRSASADDEYFSDGLADELLNVLAKIKGLRVTARTSSFHFKGKDVTIAEIGRELGVATVLEGSVRKAGNRVRIGVQLVRVSDSTHLWSESYDRTLEDIFAVQDDIAHSVVKELRSKLLGLDDDSKASGEVWAELVDAAKGRATDPEAHRLYLLALFLTSRGKEADFAKARTYFRQAVELDPGFALAWARLSRVIVSQTSLAWIPFHEGLAAANEAVERALSLEPDLADAHAALATIRIGLTGDWAGAAEASRRARELAPGSSDVIMVAGRLELASGRTDVAIATLQLSLELDPLNVGAHAALGLALACVGRLAEAEASLRRGLELSPGNASVHARLALNLLESGRSDGALAEAALETDEFLRHWILAIVHRAGGREDESRPHLQFLVDDGDPSSVQIAGYHAWFGETDAAFEWLERGRSANDPGINQVRILREFNRLQGDPRWPAFLRSLGFDVP